HAAELEIVQHGQFRKDVTALRHVADAGGNEPARSVVGDLLAVIGYSTGPHRQHPERRLEGGRFAGAVRTDDRRARTAADAAGQPAQNRLRAVAGDDVFEAQDLVSGQDTPRSLWDRGGSPPGRLPR